VHVDPVMRVRPQIGPAPNLGTTPTPGGSPGRWRPPRWRCCLDSALVWRGQVTKTPHRRCQMGPAGKLTAAPRLPRLQVQLNFVVISGYCSHVKQVAKTPAPGVFFAPGFLF